MSFEDILGLIGDRVLFISGLGYDYNPSVLEFSSFFTVLDIFFNLGLKSAFLATLVGEPFNFDGELVFDGEFAAYLRLLLLLSLLFAIAFFLLFLKVLCNLLSNKVFGKIFIRTLLATQLQ